MRLYEHEAKIIFRQQGIPVPRQIGIAGRPEDLDAMDLSFPLVIKALVLTGGRGKAGGVQKAGSRPDAGRKIREILGSTIRGYAVERCLVEEAVQELGAFYLGITMDPADYSLVFMASASGGVDIETAARENPGAILKKVITDNAKKLPENTSAGIADFLVRDRDRSGDLRSPLIGIIESLYALYQQFDCRMAEINPLIITPSGPVAADAKVVLDDNGLYRQGALLEAVGIRDTRHDVSEPSRNELRARAAGIPYVDLLPENHRKDDSKLYVGLVPGGAGYGIFSIDETANIGDRFFDGRVVPVNFMDSGGGPPRGRVAEMFHLLMDYPIVDVIITSRFGGISSCDTFIRGLIDCLRERRQKGLRMVPVFGRMVGTDLSSARDFLKQAKSESPEALKDLSMVVGNRVIMADIIREAITRAFEIKGLKR
ncbi:MAG TPA: hypothetical protein ENN03_10870 [bacterium]|nr:hypothetical protein [bacterium]